VTDQEAEIDILRQLVRANAEHADSLVAEKRALVAKIRELEQKPPTYEQWVRDAYTRGVDSLSEDIKRTIAGLEKTVADQKAQIDLLSQPPDGALRVLSTEAVEELRRAYYALEQEGHEGWSALRKLADEIERELDR
jgi:phage shock protein A